MRARSDTVNIITLHALHIAQSAHHLSLHCIAGLLLCCAPRPAASPCHPPKPCQEEFSLRMRRSFPKLLINNLGPEPEVSARSQLKVLSVSG